MSRLIVTQVCSGAGAVPLHQAAIGRKEHAHAHVVSISFLKVGRFAVNSTATKQSQDANECAIKYIRNNMTLVIRGGFSTVAVNAQLLFGSMFGINMAS